MIPACFGREDALIVRFYVLSESVDKPCRRSTVNKVMIECCRNVNHFPNLYLIVLHDRLFLDTSYGKGNRLRSTAIGNDESGNIL